MKPPLSKVPAAGLALAMVGGIIFCSVLHAQLSTGPWPWILATIWILGIIALFTSKAFYIALCLLMGGMGYGICVLSAPPQISHAPGTLVINNALVESVSGPAHQPTLRLKILNATGVKAPPFLGLLTVSRSEHPWLPGDTLRGTVRFEYPQVAALGNNENYYRARGLSARGYAFGSQLKCVPGHCRSLRYLPSRACASLRHLINDGPLSPGTDALLTATLLGDRADTPEQLVQDFRSLGLAHILSISGFHVGIIAGFFSFMFFPLRALRRRGLLWQSLLALAAVWFYVLMTGSQPAAIRAGIMFSLFILGRLSSRGVSPLNSLCWAAIIILLINPFWLYEAGFLLSFSAVAGILLLVPKLTPAHLRGFRRWTWQAVLVPIAAVIGTLPASLWTFHAFPLLFLPANILISILFPLLLISAGLALLLWNLGLRLSFLAWPADEIYALIEKSVQAAAALPGTYLSNLAISHAQIWLLTLGLCCIVIALYTSGHWTRRIAPTCAAIAFMAAACVFIPKPEPPEAHLAMTKNRMAMCVIENGRHSVFFLNGTTPAENDSMALAATFRRQTAGSIPLTEIKQAQGLRISGKHICFNERDTDQVIDLLIIHRGFRPDSTTLRRLAPAKALICPDLSDTQRRRILGNLRQQNIPTYLLQTKTPQPLTPLLSNQ